MRTSRYVLLSDRELAQLAAGIVTPSLERRAARLNEQLQDLLRRNAARRPKATPASAREDR